jgi:hypothetical protein
MRDVPYAYVDWCVFRGKKYNLTSFEGDITQAEWDTGPSAKPNINPFVTMDDILPSRFVLAYSGDLDVAFLSLDPERIGETVDDGTFTDFGDDVLCNKVRELKSFLRPLDNNII